jgi:hypothetical protein
MIMQPPDANPSSLHTRTAAISLGARLQRNKADVIERAIVVLSSVAFAA